MNIVDRRPNPKGKSLSNRQRFLGARPRRGQIGGAGGAAQAQGRRCRAGREGSDPDARDHRADLSPQPAHRPHRACRSRQQGVCQGRRDPAADRRRRARRLAGQPGRIGRGRLRVHAVEGRVPRHVLRGPRTPRPRQKEPQRDLRGRSAARRLHGHRQPGQPQHPAHDAQQHGPAHLAAAAEAVGARSDPRGDRRSPRPRRRRGGRKAGAASSSGSSAAARSFPTSTRSMSATTASSACRGPIPRR